MSVSHALNAHLNLAPATKIMVWFGGDDVALLEGQGVCYNVDYGTAATREGSRGNRVELPTQSNNQWFAGVCVSAYAGSPGGRFIEIYVPGSVCNILANTDTVIDTGRLTCEAGGSLAGYFRLTGFPGEGSAVPLQTNDALTATAGLVLAKLEEGGPSFLAEEVDVADNAAIVCMVGGMTKIEGAAIGTGDSTFVLADGTKPGIIKGFYVGTAITSNDFVITVTSGLQMDGTALATLTFNAAAEFSVLRWDGITAGALWVVQVFAGVTEG